MKRKTQIKRKAKRMLSLLLTAMLLISTMVVGISTVSAATERTVYFVNRSNWSTVKAYCWYNDGSKDVPETPWSGNVMTKVGTYDGSDLYKYTLDTKYTKIIFNNGNSGDGNQTGNLTIPTDGKNMYDSNITGNDKWTTYSELTPVATDLTLTSDKSSIVKGQSAILTATLTGKVDTDVTLTLTGGDTTQTATVSGDDTTATFTVSPTSTTTYTVTASAENYSSKSATTTISVTVPDTYYLWTSAYDDVTNANTWTSTELTYSDGSYVGNVIFPKNGQNYFFTINKSSNSVRESSIWSSDSEVKENLSSAETSGFTSSIGAQENNGVHLARVSFQKTNTDVKFTFTPEKTVVISRNSTTPVEKVTINVPDVDNATVTATSDDTTAAEGESLTIAKDSTFTVTVTPDDGYELASIAYNGETKTASPATFTAAVSGDIAVTVNKKETPTEPSTEPTTEPTTAPAEDAWYLKGDFNSWGTSNPLTGSDDTLTTNVYIDSSKVHEFKVWNENGNKYYGTQTPTSVVNKTIENYVVHEAASSTLNVKFQPENSGIYKFTFDPSTLTLNAELVQSGLNVEVTAPESVKAGETFSITAKAIPDSTITPASYKFTIMIGGTVVVKEAVSTTTQYTYNKATISAPAYVSAFVEAFDADGNIIGASPTVECEHQTIDTYDDLTVQLSANGSEVVAGTEVTLTAAATPASYVSSYDFLISKSYDFKEDVGVDTKTSTSSTLKYKFDTVGTYYVKVVAHNKYGQTVNAALDATSNIIEITVVESVGEHEVTFYFKAPSTFAYFPKMTLDGTALTVTKGDELGASFTGSVIFYWYKATATVDSSSTHTLAVSTRRTNASGSMTGNFYGSEYWLAIDNLMSGKTLANLTSLQPYIRNYYHSPLHTVYAGVADDGTLGFTNIDGKRYAMGSYADGDPSTANATLSIKAATAAQKSVTQSETYSEVQTCLLDVNLDGKVDIFDATMIQRALVNIQ